MRILCHTLVLGDRIIIKREKKINLWKTFPSRTRSFIPSKKTFLSCTTAKLLCVCLCVHNVCVCVCACMSACMVNRLLCTSFEILLTETRIESGGVGAWREYGEDFSCLEMACSFQDISSVTRRCTLPQTHTLTPSGPRCVHQYAISIQTHKAFLAAINNHARAAAWL